MPPTLGQYKSAAAAASSKTMKGIAPFRHQVGSSVVLGRGFKAGATVCGLGTAGVVTDLGIGGKLGTPADSFGEEEDSVFMFMLLRR